MPRARLPIATTALVFLTGCYSTAAFRGDGQIEEAPEPRVLYRITFPGIDVAKKGTHEFRFSGAPARGPMAVLLASPDTERLGSGSKQIITRIEDHRGGLIEERGTREGWTLAFGKPGPRWSEFISWTTDYDVPTARMETLRSGRTYTLKVDVLKDSPNGPTMVSPAIVFLRPSWGP